MTSLPSVAIQPRQEHSVPWFWPLAAAIELGEEGREMVQKNLRYAATTAEIISPPASDWAYRIVHEEKNLERVLARYCVLDTVGRYGCA